MKNRKTVNRMKRVVNSQSYEGPLIEREWGYYRTKNEIFFSVKLIEQDRRNFHSNETQFNKHKWATN